MIRFEFISRSIDHAMEGPEMDQEESADHREGSYEVSHHVYVNLGVTR